MMYETIKSLRHSRGFYSRLYDALMYNIKYNKEDLLDFLNNSELPEFKDTSRSDEIPPIITTTFFFIFISPNQQ